MSKTFQWTDELAEEYAKQHRFSSSRISVEAFKESKIKEPERIEVNLIWYNQDLILSNGAEYSFNTKNGQIHPDKFPAIKQAIENVLNEPELGSKINFKKTDSSSYDSPPLSRCLHDEAGQWGEGKPLKFTQPKKYTEKDMEDCFEQSRLTHPMVGFKHDTFQDYLQSLNK